MSLLQPAGGLFLRGLLFPLLLLAELHRLSCGLGAVPLETRLLHQLGIGPGLHVSNKSVRFETHPKETVLTHQNQPTPLNSPFPLENTHVRNSPHDETAYLECPFCFAAEGFRITFFFNLF